MFLVGHFSPEAKRRKKTTLCLHPLRDELEANKAHDVVELEVIVNKAGLMAMLHSQEELPGVPTSGFTGL